MLALALGGCSTEVDGFGAFGTFTLVSVDGGGLPASLEDGTQVTSGTLELTDEGECASRVSATPPGAPGVQPQVGCTWSRSGETVALVWPDGSPSFGSRVADTLTFTISATTPGCPPVPGSSCSPSEWRYER